MTIRCPSNGRSASSTSGLLAPAAQTSVGRPSCSCLPWPGSASSPSQASPSSIVVVLSARRGQCGQQPTSIERVLYMQRLTAGSTAAARKCLLITRKIIIPPPDSRDPPDAHQYITKKTFAPDCWDPPDGPSYFVKKTFPPLTGRTHQLYLRTQGSASLLRTKK